MAGGPREHSYARQILERVESLTTPPDEDAQIVPADLSRELLRALGDAHLRLQAHLPQHPLQE